MGTDRREHAELLGARDGDAACGRALMQRHGPSMVRTAWRVLGRYGKREAEDVVQEAFVAALTTDALPTGDIGAWLRAITARKGLDWLRRNQRLAEQALPEVDDSIWADGEEGAARASVSPEILALRHALSGLSAMDRAVLLLADVEGYSMAEVAQALDSTRGAIKLRASRARRKLARMLLGQGKPKR